MNLPFLTILSANLAAVIMIVLILVYLAEDRRRFRVERQFPAVRDLFDKWVGLAASLPDCDTLAAEYEKTRNISKKYRLIADMITASHGYSSKGMAMIERALVPFTQVYMGLAENYNRHLVGRFSGRLMRSLGFRPLPLLSFDTENNDQERDNSHTQFSKGGTK